jgi:hypothetical protein
MYIYIYIYTLFCITIRKGNNTQQETNMSEHKHKKNKNKQISINREFFSRLHYRECICKHCFKDASSINIHSFQSYNYIHANLSNEASSKIVGQGWLLKYPVRDNSTIQTNHWETGSVDVVTRSGRSEMVQFKNELYYIGCLQGNNKGFPSLLEAIGSIIPPSEMYATIRASCTQNKKNALESFLFHPGDNTYISNEVVVDRDTIRECGYLLPSDASLPIDSGYNCLVRQPCYDGQLYEEGVLLVFEVKNESHYVKYVDGTYTTYEITQKHNSLLRLIQRILEDADVQKPNLYTFEAYSMKNPRWDQCHKRCHTLEKKEKKKKRGK